MIHEVEQWFKNRDMQDADPQKQMLKLMEEVGELSAAITRNDEIETIDALGDIQVVLIGLALQLNLKLNDCLEYAYNEIKDRKGKMVAGIFVKEEDLKEDEVFYKPVTNANGLAIGRTDKDAEGAYKNYTKALMDWRSSKYGE